MAKRTFSHLNWTPGATADGSTLAAGFMALKGGSGTQKIDILEVMFQGMAGASAPTPLILAYDSTIGVTPTALATPDADGPNDPATAALAAPPVSYVAASTNPTRSNSTSSPKFVVGANAFGGVVRWNASPTQQASLLGNTASLGELSLSCFTGGTPGLIQSHIMYEPY
jgi:hypothetical protein